MRDTASVVPSFSDGDLEIALQEIVGPDLTLLSRVSTDYMSSHSIEFVSIEVGDERLDLMCKYSPPFVDPVTGHMRGVPYEAEIYRHVFPDADLSTPTCFGSFQLDDSIECIVLERVDGYRASSAPDPRSLIDVCGDLGRFHSGGVGSLPRVHNVFNERHFSKLMSEMEMLPGVSHRLGGSGEAVVRALVNAPRALIHGELYPANVLITDEGPVVIDWETAGVGPGVFDLAVLTQGRWAPELVDECEEVYWRERGRALPAFGGRDLAAARIMAAGQLLLHLRAKDTEGVQEEIALETIGTQASRLRS